MLGMRSNAGPATSIAGKRVSATLPTDGQVCSYQASSGLWLPQSLGSVPGGTSILYITTTPFSCAGNATTQAVYSFSVPANTLPTNGDGLEVVVWGGLTNASGTKGLYLSFGATGVSSNNYSAFGVQVNWVIRAFIMRTGASAQISVGEWQGAQVGNPSVDPAAPAETLSGAITLKFECKTFDSNAACITAAGMVVRKVSNAP